MSKRQEFYSMSKQYRDAFVNRITTLRISKKLTKKKVAECLGISYSYICKLEDGLRFPDSSIVATFANFYGVTTDYLLGLSDEVSPKYASACFSDITIGDLGNLSEKAQEEINSFIKYIIQRDGDKASK